MRMLCSMNNSQSPTIHIIMPRRTGIRWPSRNTCLRAGWWDGEDNDMTAKFFGTGGRQSSKPDQQYDDVGGRFRRKASPSSDMQNYSPSLITTQMEDEVMASARATMDKNTVTRAVSSLIEDETTVNTPVKKGRNRLRELAMGDNDIMMLSSSIDGNTEQDTTESTWDAQQVAIASGATTFLLSPLVIPIIHSLLPPIIPSPSSISLTGAALLGTIAYIVALGDTTQQSNPISGTAGGGVLGDGVEVGGAVSRILGRTALQSVQTSAPRLKAAARALVDCDSNTASLEELRRVQDELMQSVSALETENDDLRRELALWREVEDVSNMYKLEELKEIARYHGLKGYSTDGKNSLLRRLAKEGILKLDLTSKYT